MALAWDVIAKNFPFPSAEWNLDGAQYAASNSFKYCIETNESYISFVGQKGDARCSDAYICTLATELKQKPHNDASECAIRYTVIIPMRTGNADQQDMNINSGHTRDAVKQN